MGPLPAGFARCLPLVRARPAACARTGEGASEELRRRVLIRHEIGGWRRLSGSKTGFAFRRQLVVAEYSAYFVCTKVLLVVEARSGGDLGHLVNGVFKTASLMSVSVQIDTRTASGRMVLNILATISQWEREAVGERTSAVMYVS